MQHLKDRKNLVKVVLVTATPRFFMYIYLRKYMLIRALSNIDSAALNTISMPKAFFALKYYKELAYSETFIVRVLSSKVTLVYTHLLK